MASHGAKLQSGSYCSGIVNSATIRRLNPGVVSPVEVGCTELCPQNTPDRAYGVLSQAPPECAGDDGSVPGCKKTEGEGLSLIVFNRAQVVTRASIGIALARLTAWRIT